MHCSKRMERLSAPGLFAMLLQIKRELADRGTDVIDLSVGSPDNGPAPHVVEEMTRALQEPGAFRYTISDLPELKAAVAHWYQRRFGVELAPEEITSLLGSQEGLGHIGLCLVDPGDVILAPDPGYPVFHTGAEVADGSLYLVPQRRENGYVMDLRDIPEDVARRAKLLIVSYPNNPTAALAPESFYHDLVAFARQYDVAVLHDNAYCELVFDGRRTGSFLQVPGARKVGVEFNSLSKTYGFAGARMGFAMGNREIVDRIATLKSHLDYGAFLPVQRGAIAALTGPQDSVDRVRQTYERRRDLLCDGLKAAGWTMDKPAATMFVWAPVPGRYTTTMEFVRDLVERSGVLVSPGDSFGPGGEGYVRMALVQPEDRLAVAVQRVAACGILRP